MTLKKGDKVKFLNDVGGGVLTAVLDKDKVMVRTGDGFEIPVKIADLIADTGDFMTPGQPEEPVERPEVKNPPKKEKTVPKVPDFNKEEELCFAIIPKPESSDLFAYMINNTSYNIHYVISTKGEDETLLFDQGSLEARTRMKIKKFLPANLNELTRFDIQVLYYKDDFYLGREPLSMSVFMAPSEVYSGKALEENDYFDRKALVFTLSDFTKKPGFSRSGGVSVTELLKEKVISEKPAKQAPGPAGEKSGPREVDLHIESITENYSELSNSEILDMQMARFKIALDTAVIHRERRIIFIHGVGNGKLKFTLRKAIDEQYPDLQYQDASFKEYGYGATMVIIP